MDVEFGSEVDDKRRVLRFTCVVHDPAAEFNPAGLGLRIGDDVPVEFTPPAPGPAGSLRFPAVEIAAATLLACDSLSLKAVVAGPQPLEALARVTFAGDLFRALTLETPEDFHRHIQLHHSRFASPVLLEIGARAAFLGFKDNFLVRTAALVVMAHRIFERRSTELEPSDFDRAARIVRLALAEVALGEALIERGGARPDWQHVRWTVSLATIAGYLALLNNRYTEAASLFEVNLRQVPNVQVARVSALNLVTGCFTHGLIMSALGLRERARDSFSAGLEAVKPVVAAQDLFENVWVIGDLMNVMRAARQCFIALARLKLRNFRDQPPVLDPGDTIEIAEVKSPLRQILAAGRAPLLAEHLNATLAR